MLVSLLSWQVKDMDKQQIKGQLKEQIKKLVTKGCEIQQPPANDVEDAKSAGQGIEQPVADEVEEENGIFQKASRIRMIEEEVEYKQFLGEIARVERSLAGGNVLVQFENVKLGLAPRAMPAVLFEAVELCKPAVELRTMVRVPRWVKKGLLRKAGVQDPEWDMLTKFKAKDQASEDNIDTFGETVVWSLQLEEQAFVKFVPAALASRILSDSRAEAYSAFEPLPAQDVVDKRVAQLRHYGQNYQQLLIPIYSPRVEGSCQHWTLLVVQRIAGNLSFKYFDSLHPPHLRCLSNANRILRLLGGQDQQIEQVDNRAIQEGQDCGWYVCHWIEEYLRRAAQHPKHSQGWPFSHRLSKLTTWLSRIVITLEGEREKWREEAIKAEAELKKAELKLRDSSAAFLRRKNLLARVVETHRQVGVEALLAGASGEPLPLDESFLLRYQQHQQWLREQRDARRAAAAAAVAPAAAAAVPPDVIKELENKVRNSKDLDLFELVLSTARVEDLGKEQQEHYKKVEATGIGVCSRCRWKSGCLSCDKEKAWKYVVKWELGMRALDVEKAPVGQHLPKPAGGGCAIEACTKKKHTYNTYIKPHMCD